MKELLIASSEESRLLVYPLTRSESSFSLITMNFSNLTLDNSNFRLLEQFCVPPMVESTRFY